ncbi:hypothetical protein CWATWH0003_3753 [Crocosphaera watsonii WH 0003]|nr:hypothetical protein CWATWH0003_3753 [Crocosphaera watsonii WH 0003]
MALIICLILALLCGLLGLGRPQVNVAISLDLSSSTYTNNGQTVGTSKTIQEQEIEAVYAYLDYNQQRLKRPNQVQVFGFGGNVQPLTPDFSNDTSTVKSQLMSAIANPNLISAILPELTDINRAISTGTNALSTIPQGCRELLLVTDGEATVSPETIANAAFNRVKLNIVVVGDQSPTLQSAAIATGGIYLSGEAQTLDRLFTQRLFSHFNSNLPWVIFWLGCAWISLMWMLCLPLNRLIFQQVMKLNWHKASQLALANALFWTVVTPCIIWGVAGTIPLISGC